MIVPQYWAEGRVQHRQRGRQVTVRRFGWSDASQEEAQGVADLRAQEALERIVAGKSLPRREPKVPYNGAAGVPIREEIISRDGETVITRNAYGAHCLNTPNVLFVDIDFEHVLLIRFEWAIFLFLFCFAGLSGMAWTHSKVAAVAIALVVAISYWVIARSFLGAAIDRNTLQRRERRGQQRVERFLLRNPQWSARLYRTPAGLRVMATHRTFEPSDPAVAECFRALGADPVYARMCLNQQCFRARVTAKPWRIGVAHHLQAGVWPVAAERMPLREAWIAEYEAAASSFAACQFIETLGSGANHPDVRRVQQWHDELSRATSTLPIA